MILLGATRSLCFSNRRENGTTQLFKMITEINSAKCAPSMAMMQPSKSPRRHSTQNKYSHPCRHILPHGSYLVNLAQNDKVKAQQAYASFLDDLRRCEALGITLYNFQ